MCPENEFGQYEYSVQEKVTTKKIEHDLQKVYKSNIIMHLVLLPFFALLDGVYICLIWNYLKDGKDLPIFLIITNIICVLFTVAIIIDFIHSIYMLFSGYKKFSIAIDRFRGIRTVVRHHRRRTVTYYYLMFNQCGEVQFLPEAEYYTWSENYRMRGDGINKSVHIGDRFFLIMRGKKILYFYNDRMFDLSETLKTTRTVSYIHNEPTLKSERTEPEEKKEEVFH